MINLALLDTVMFSSTAKTASVEVRQLLEDSIRVHLQTDVPLGVFLSGGIDSTVVAALAAENKSTPIKTFSIGFHISFIYIFTKIYFSTKNVQKLKYKHIHIFNRHF